MKMLEIVCIVGFLYVLHAGNNRELVKAINQYYAMKNSNVDV